MRLEVSYICSTVSLTGPLDVGLIQGGSALAEATGTTDYALWLSTTCLRVGSR